MIDIHLLQHPRQDRLDNILSLTEKLSGVPGVYLQILQGHKDNITTGRLQGFNSGWQKYVSFVDDDDDILPEIIPQCVEILEANPHLAAVVTMEQQNNKSSCIIPHRKSQELLISPKELNYVHHLVVLRRSILNKYLPILNKANAFPEFTLWATMLLDGCKFYYLPKLGYIWNNNGDALKLKLPVTEYTKTVINQCLTFNSRR